MSRFDTVECPARRHSYRHEPDSTTYAECLAASQRSARAGAPVMAGARSAAPPSAAHPQPVAGAADLEGALSTVRAQYQDSLEPAEMNKVLGWVRQEADELHDHAPADPFGEEVEDYNSCTECGDSAGALAHLADVRVATDLDPILNPQADGVPADVTEAHIASATELGAEHGRSAASWVELDESSAAQVLQQHEDGDPELYDLYPGNPLSGEFADGMTSADLVQHVGLDSQDISLSYGEISDLDGAYEQAHQDAWEQALVERARTYIDDETSGAS